MPGEEEPKEKKERRKKWWEGREKRSKSKNALNRRRGLAGADAEEAGWEEKGGSAWSELM